MKKIKIINLIVLLTFIYLSFCSLFYIPKYFEGDSINYFIAWKPYFQDLLQTTINGNDSTVIIGWIALPFQILISLIIGSFVWKIFLFIQKIL